MGEIIMQEHERERIRREARDRLLVLLADTLMCDEAVYMDPDRIDQIRALISEVRYGTRA